MQLSPKQRNVIHYARHRLDPYLTYDEIDKLMALAYIDFMPEDCSVLVGDIIDLQKDEREGYGEERKRQIALEVKSIIRQYQKDL